MKKKHIDIRIRQCLILAEASNCPRRKFGAMLIDPVRNVVLMDGYNGGPRGGEGDLCGGHFCHRNGITAADTIEYEKGLNQVGRGINEKVVRVYINGGLVKTFIKQPLEKLDEETTLGPFDFTDTKPSGNPALAPLDELAGKKVEAKVIPSTIQRAEAWVEELTAKYPPVKSGTKMEIGCHHAESNVICNAAAEGIACKGALLIVTGEPCLKCAKDIHHAGITKVIVVDGGYAGGKDGVEYLRLHSIQVQEVSGPKDPRLSIATTVL